MGYREEWEVEERSEVCSMVNGKGKSDMWPTSSVTSSHFPIRVHAQTSVSRRERRKEGGLEIRIVTFVKPQSKPHRVTARKLPSRIRVAD